MTMEHNKNYMQALRVPLRIDLEVYIKLFRGMRKKNHSEHSLHRIRNNIFICRRRWIIIKYMLIKFLIISFCQFYYHS